MLQVAKKTLWLHSKSYKRQSAHFISGTAPKTGSDREDMKGFCLLLTKGTTADWDKKKYRMYLNMI